MFHIRKMTLCAALLACAGGSALAQTAAPAAPGAAPAGPPRPPFTLTSTAFADSAVIPDRFSQSTGNPPANWGTSPQLSWVNAPANTQSYTILLHDMEPAPGRNTMDVTHWLAFNIPGTMTALPEGVAMTPTLPDGTVQIKNTRNNVGFMGPGAGPGLYHHYAFELYALDTKLTLGPDATRAQVMAAMDGHVNGKAVLVGRWHR